MGESEQFSISDVAADDTTVVKVAGEIDMETGPAFRQGLLRALGAGRGGLIVDLSQATFLDSTALTSLVNAFDDLRRQGGGNLVIVATDPRMRALFDVARLDRDFRIFETRADAIAAISGAPETA
ncbi:MAG: anti-sigma factor antagonist [Thermoleophilaceae bacterium]|jgi:anti-sigma B factor antagonist|nr:anti-sigma factor antagonist [Thermoleophilaceae bacterium]